MSEAFDAAVIGGGMLGASVAHHLARRGRRVTVIDLGDRFSDAATLNSFAWLNAVSKEPESYHFLNAAGMKEYDALESELGATLVNRTGCIELAGVAVATRLQEKVRRLQDRRYAARMASLVELRRLEPGLSLDGIEAAALYERDGWVDAPAVRDSLLGAVRAAGGVVVYGSVVESPRAAPGGMLAIPVKTLESAPETGEVVTARTIVVCAGKQSPFMAELLGFTLPMDLGRWGVLAVTTPVDRAVLRHITYAPGFHIRPDASGGVRIGADDIDQRCARLMYPPRDVTTAHGAELLERARARLSGLSSVGVAKMHAAMRPYPADGLTVAGRLPGWDNVYVAVTHSGITLGPLLGRLLAEEITTGRIDPLLAPFRPERFARPA